MAKKLIFLAVIILLTGAQNVLAAPVISSVSQTTNGLIIQGSSLVSEDQTNWLPKFKNSTTYSFEGASPAADGYLWPNNSEAKCGTYDKTVYLMGNQSMEFTASGNVAGSDSNLANAQYTAISTGTGALQRLYIRTYVRWDLLGGGWPSNHIKMLDSMATTGDPGVQYYFQPEAGSTLPSQMSAVFPEPGLGNANHYINIPSGQIQNNRWYCIEVLWDGLGSPYKFQAWIDGQLVFDGSPTSPPGLRYLMLGLINLKGTTASFALKHWMDGFTVSTSRIYPAAKIEIGNSPNYGSGSEKWQAPVYLSDGKIQIDTDLNGLGAGPYYLWVTDNKQERVRYDLGTDVVSGQAVTTTTPPAGSSSSTSSSSSSSPTTTTTPPTSSSTTVTPLFTESFDNSSLSSRGWYDNTNLSITAQETAPGSQGAVEFHFPVGATQPTSGGSIRHKFTDTDAVYLSYWVKYSSNWVGSGKTYHPHEIMLLTNKDGDWGNLAFTYLTTYIEQNALHPRIAIQDGQNIDLSNLNANLVGVTEARSVAGCNGDSDGYGNGSCYAAGGGTYWNGKEWQPAGVNITAGSWHKVEAYVKLNSIVNGKGVTDGIMRYWLDGQQVMNYSDVMFRTGLNPDMKFNQFVIAPWIGDGSPIDQTFWIDDLTVTTAPPTTTGGGTTQPPAPTTIQPPGNLRITAN